MSAPGVITLGLGRSPGEVLLLGLASSTVTQGGGLVTLGLGLTPSRVLLHGMATGSEPPPEEGFELDAPLSLPLAGTVSLAGEFEFPAPTFPLEIEPTTDLALTGTVALSGELLFSDQSTFFAVNGRKLRAQKPRARARPDRIGGLGQFIAEEEDEEMAAVIALMLAEGVL